MNLQSKTKAQLIQEIKELNEENSNLRNSLHIEAEQSIEKENINTFTEFFNNSPEGIHIYKMNENKELILEACNKMACEIFNMDCRKSLGLTITEVFPGLEETEIPDEFIKVISTWEPFKIDNFQYTFDDRISFINITAFKLLDNQLAVIFRDITEEKLEKKNNRANEYRFSALFEHSSDITWIVDQDYNVEYVSPSVRSHLGYLPEELTGKNGMQFIHEDDMEIVEVEINKIARKTNDHSPTELRFRHKEGHWIYVEIIANNLLDHTAIGGIVINMRDVSERKRAESAITESAELYRTLIDTIPDPVMVCDLDSFITFASPKSLEFFGYESVEEMLGLSIFELMAPEKHEESRQVFEDFLSNDETMVLETVVLKKDGTRIVAEINNGFIRDNLGNKLSIIGTLKDITARRNSEELLKTQRDLVLKISENDDILDVLNNCLHASLDLTDLDAGGIYLLDRETQDFNLQVHCGLSDEFVNAVRNHTVKKDNYKLIQKGEPFHIKNSTLKNGLPELYIKEEITSVAVIPILYNNQVIACINLASKKFDEIPPEIWYSLESLSVQFGVIIARTLIGNKLSESEKRYKTLFNQAGDAIFIMKNDIYIDCNDRTLNMFECTRDQILGKPPYLFSPEKQPDGMSSIKKASEKINNALEQGPQVFEWRHKKYSGEEFYAEVSLSKVEILGEKHLQAILRDITLRKDTERALKESEVQYRTVVENANIAIMVIQNGIVKFVNNTVLKMTDFTMEEMIDKNFLDFVAVDERERLAERYQQRMEGKLTDEITTFKYLTKSGQSKWCELKPVVIDWKGELASLNFLIDIDEQRNMMTALKDSEEKYRYLVENIQEGFFIVQNSKLQFVNKSLSTMSGYSIEEMTDNSFSDFVAPEYRNLVKSMNLKRLSNKDTPSEYDFKILKKDGKTKVDVHVHAELVNYHGNIATIGTIKDITEKKKAEKEQRKLISIIENSNEFIGIANLDGQVTYLNKFGLNFVGLKTQEEARSQKIDDFVDDDFKNTLNQHIIPRVFREGYATGEGRLLNLAEGKRIDIEYNVFLLKSPETGELMNIVAVMRDITERKKAEEKLVESEEKLRTITSSAQDAIIMIDHSGRISFWNEAAEKTFGYSEEEIIGENLHKLLAPSKYIDKITQGFRKFQETGDGSAVDRTMEFSAMRKDGIEFSIELSLSRVKLKGKWSAIGIVRDITERKLAEEKLRESEERFRQLAEMLPQTIFETDLQANLTYSNNEAFETFGYTLEEFNNGLNAIEMLAPENREEGISKFQKVMNGDPAEVGEYMAIKKDGTRFPVLNYSSVIYKNGIPVGLRGILLDISELKEQEKALIESEKRFRTIFESAQDSIFIKDGNHKYLQVNRAMKDLFGSKIKDYIGSDNSFIFGNEDYDHAKSIDDRVLNGEIIKQEHTVLINDVRHDFDVIKVPMADASGDIYGLCGIARDISERKEVELRIKDINAELENKVKERTKQLSEAYLKLEKNLEKEKELSMMKTRFISMISHEYRTPLTVILSSSHLVQHYLGDSNKDKIEKHLKKIHTSVKLMTRLLEDVITVGKSEESEIKVYITETGINKLVNSIIEENQEINFNSHKFTFRKRVKSDTINTDSILFRQILNNLLSNAAKYSPENTEIEIGMNEKNGNINLYVEDNGCGISEKDQRRLFEPFFRKKEHIGSIPGSGLGLTIIKRSVDALGGSLDVESKENQGSRFTVTLPKTYGK